MLPSWINDEHSLFTAFHWFSLLFGGFEYFICSSLLGEMIQSEEHIFQQAGNHQLVLFASSFPSVLQQVFNHFPPFQLRNHRNGIKKTRRRGNSELGTREELKLDRKTDLWWKNSGYMMATVYIYIHTYICVCEYVKSTNYFCSKFMTSLNWCRIFCINQEYH